MTTLLFHYVFCVLPFWGGELDIAQESEKGGQDTGSLISITIFFWFYIPYYWSGLNHFNQFFYHVICPPFFSFGSYPANSAFPAVFTMCFLLGKQNCIIPKLNSDWLIPIKVHPSFKKNRMRFYSIKVLQTFWLKFSLTVVTVKNPSKTLTKKTLLVTTGLNVLVYNNISILFCSKTVIMTIVILYLYEMGGKRKKTECFITMWCCSYIYLFISYVLMFMRYLV